jgi:hypothetical protein
MDLVFPITINGHYFAYVMIVDSFVMFLITSNCTKVVALINLNHTYQEIFYTQNMGQSPLH